MTQYSDLIMQFVQSLVLVTLSFTTAVATVALLSPKAFRRVEAVLNYRVDTSWLSKACEHSVEIDQVLGRYPRLVGAVSLATSVSVLATLLSR